MWNIFLWENRHWNRVQQIFTSSVNSYFYNNLYLLFYFYFHGNIHGINMWAFIILLLFRPQIGSLFSHFLPTSINLYKLLINEFIFEIKTWFWVMILGYPTYVNSIANLSLLDFISRIIATMQITCATTSGKPFPARFSVFLSLAISLSHSVLFAMSSFNHLASIASGSGGRYRVVDSNSRRTFSEMLRCSFPLSS